MKKVLTFSIVLIGACLLSGYLFPWWSICITSSLVAYAFRSSPLKSFGIGFASITLVWTVLAIFINLSNHSKIVEMISAVFMNIGPNNLYFVSGLIGG
ncbi:MAG: hypothetical protein ABIO44_06825, partial [Saprospiraceae bacterium]